jgi:hypothetical protein
MRQSIIRVLATLITLSLAFGVAQADRRTSLRGNMLIKDRDDTFIFPQLAVKYNKSVSIDFGANQDSGNALFIAGPNKKSAFAIALHRGDAVQFAGNSYDGSFEPGMISNSNGVLSYPMSVAGMAESAQPSVIADLIYAMKMGKNKLGFRLGFVGFGKSLDNDGDHVATDSSFGLRLGAGYSMGKKGDFAFNLAFGSGAITSGQDTDDVADTSVLGVGVTGRYFLTQGKKFKLGTLFDIGFVSESNTDYTANNDPQMSRSLINLMAGFGPVYRKKDKYTVAFHGHFGVRMQNEDPNSEVDDDDLSAMSVMFPGFNVAMEYRVLDWLDFRSGASYSYLIATSDAQGKQTTTGNDSGAFGWDAGFGILLEDLKINGTLSHGFVTGGPQFIGGYAGGLFSMVSVVGNFGGGKKKGPKAPAAK